MDGRKRLFRAVNRMVVGVQDMLFQVLPCVERNGMYNIPKGTVFLPSARHSDKKAFRPLHDFDVVDGNFVVQCNGNNGAEPSVIHQLADFNVRNIHGFSSLFCIQFWAFLQNYSGAGRRRRNPWKNLVYFTI